MPVKRPPKDGLVRALPGLELRAADPTGDENEQYPLGVLTGHFLLFNRRTEINSYYEGKFLESLAPGSIKKTLQEGKDSIRCLFQHGLDYQIGEKPLGPQTSEEDDEGGFYRVPLIDTSYNRDLAPGIADNLYGVSFCFEVIREDFNEEPGVSAYNPRGLPERVLREIRILEYGPVTFPAYEDPTAELEGASNAMRSMTDQYLAEKLKQDPNTVELVLERAAQPDELAALFRSRNVRNVPRLQPRTEETPEEPESEPIEERSAQQLVDAAQEAAEASAAGEPKETEADEAEETVTAGDEPAADEQKRSDAPPEGAEPEAHPQAGRRENPQTKATRAAADDKEQNMKTRAEIEARQAEIRSRLVAINEEHGEDAVLPEETQTEYDGLVAERSENEKALARIEQRKATVAALAADEPNEEIRSGGTERGTGQGEQRARQVHPAPYDLPEIMSRARGAASADGARAYMRDAALRAIDQERVFYHDMVDEARAKESIEKLLRRESELTGYFRSEVAERIIATGSDEYKRAFAKAVTNSPLTSEEQRALASFVGAEGGYAIPYTLDPTLIPTSNSIVNPYRAISRVETILGNEWKGVTSGAVTVEYAEESHEAADATPVLAQPTANPERVQAWIPYSMEADQDWPAMLSEMAILIAEGKDDAEAAKFTLGAGHANKEPEGLITGATKIVKTATTATYVLEDLYSLEEALKPRFRPRAQWVANRFFYNKTRQFDVYGGAALWVRLPEGLGNQVPTPGKIQPTLAGYPAWEASSIETGIVSTHKIAVIGDFRYFLIVDRIGMNIETVQTVFGAGQKPTGQRGLYAFWRNTSKVLSPEAFRVLEVK